MIAYIIVFCLTTFLLRMVRWGTGIKKTLLLTCSALLIISIFSGVRANFVGTDTASYPIGCFRFAINSSSYAVYDELVKDYFSMNEIGYENLAYITAQVYPNFNFFLFICALIINAGILYFAIFASRTLKIQLWLIWFAYLMMLYNQTLNVAKQSIAVSLCLIAITLYCKNFKKTACLTLCGAVTFHFTAFVTLFLLLEKKIKNNVFRIASISIVLLTVLGNYVFLEKIIGLSSYLNRFSSYMTNADGDIALGELLFRLMIIVFFYFMYRTKQLKMDKSIVVRILFLFSIESSLFLFNAISAQAGRISMFFIPMYFIFVPFLIKSTRHRKFLTCVYVLALFAYWFVTIVCQGSTGSYPYVSVLY